MMKHIVGLRDIADQFDLYFVDQYGVLHDGVAAYPGAVDGLAKLASGGRKVIVLTNSGKGTPENLARLAALGFANSHLHAAVSPEGSCCISSGAAYLVPVLRSARTSA